MDIQTFTLVNTDKLERALNGTLDASNTAIGGVGKGAYFEGGVWKLDGDALGEKEVAVLEHAVLAEYDRLGGLIKRQGDKVETGSFFDFKAKKPRVEPKVVFLYRINGKTVKVEDGVELPGIVKAAKVLEESEAIEAEVEAEADVAPKKSKRSKK